MEQLLHLPTSSLKPNSYFYVSYVGVDVDIIDILYPFPSIFFFPFLLSSSIIGRVVLSLSRRVFPVISFHLGTGRLPAVNTQEQFFPPLLLVLLDLVFSLYSDPLYT